MASMPIERQSLLHLVRRRKSLPKTLAGGRLDPRVLDVSQVLAVLFVLRSEPGTVRLLPRLACSGSSVAPATMDDAAVRHHTYIVGYVVVRRRACVCDLSALDLRCSAAAAAPPLARLCSLAALGARAAVCDIIVRRPPCLRSYS